VQGEQRLATLHRGALLRQIDALDVAERLASEVVEADTHLPRAQICPSDRKAPPGTANLSSGMDAASPGLTMRTCGRRAASSRACRL
jgi:hypothetical protein